MILVCDENTGTGVPKALQLVGYDVRYFVELGWSGKKDPEWIPWVGQKQWLLFSCNKKILLVPEEHQLIRQHKLGIIFLTNGEEHPPKVLRLLLTKWDTLKLLWDTTERPFVRFLYPNGRLAQRYRHYRS